MLLTVLAVLAATVALSPAVSRLLGRNAGWLLALPLLIGAVIGVMTYTRPGSEEGVHTEVWEWMPTIGVDLAVRFDGLSFVFLMLVLLIGAGVLMYSTRYLGKGRNSAFYFFICGFAAAMGLLVLTDDLIVFYVAWELTTLCSFFLIANAGEKGHDPAIRTLLVTVGGGLLLLTATVVMVVATGTTRISEVLADPVWADRPGLTALVAVLIAGAAFTKSAQFPFQAWLPDSMVAIAPVSAYLHAAAMVKAGIYLVLRYSPMLADVGIWNTLLITAGLITALFGAVTAVKQDDLKALLAYSTMSQLGLLVATVGIGTETALTAAVVHTIAHACFKAALFMMIGVVEHEAGTRNYSELTAMRLKMPVTRTVVVISAASMAGIPLLFGFVSKESLIDAALHSGFHTDIVTLVTGTVVASSMFTFAYSARFIMGVWGRRSPGPIDGGEPETVREAAPGFLLVPSLLAVVTVVLGIAPFLVENPVADAALAVSGEEVTPGLALWHGFNPALALSALIIAVGAVLVGLRRPVDEFLGRFRAPVGGLEIVERLRQGTIDFGAVVTRSTGTTSMRRHLTAPIIGLVVIAVVGVLVLTNLPPVVGERSEPTDWIFVLFILLGVIAAARSQSRLNVVIVIAVIGFGITLWFFTLGAPDVATTQLMVEVLTVVVMMLVLNRLPHRFTPETRRAELWSVVVAVAAGLATVLGVLALTGRREKSEVAEYYLREAENITGGANIVNTILVEFRALDTLGELTVLGVAGISVAALLKSRPLLPVRRKNLDLQSPIAGPRENSVFLRATTKLVGPIIIAMSLLLLLRGHYETGGGFIAALVGGAGFALLYLAAPSDREAKIKWSYMGLIGAGVVTGAGVGLLGYLEGSFLAPLHFEVFGSGQSTALIFDIGVYFAVIGVVLAALNLLGTEEAAEETPDEDLGHHARSTMGKTREHLHGQPTGGRATGAERTEE
ncbi:DUF4040 family protein [Corynebacterium halotolerans]|uniref:Putative monovalent cation/H+ antiporter subunit A n=1 Tax=Corynebacterium halotolerans YIM 70093 = DSM 44683 TaxID=1121362 RepID=M1NTK7_9CORY|nr:DUF4040 family protein [Corynebacterium halotolerans]AGF72812.1 putative monovalent cation/H+ antiporter subunit A [Corynebacterium halotolerans YIM 70093 = DSM 44683]